MERRGGTPRRTHLTFCPQLNQSFYQNYYNYCPRERELLLKLPEKYNLNV